MITAQKLDFAQRQPKLDVQNDGHRTKRYNSISITARRKSRTDQASSPITRRLLVRKGNMSMLNQHPVLKKIEPVKKTRKPHTHNHDVCKTRHANGPKRT